MRDSEAERLSPWWWRSVLATILVCFTILGVLAGKTYTDAPPIPRVAVSGSGEIAYTGADVEAGQQVFLKYGLMENGTIWGHGAYLGSDFSAQYLHALALDAQKAVARRHGYLEYATLAAQEQSIVNAGVARLLKQNRYDTKSGTLMLSEIELASFHEQLGTWADYFKDPVLNGGLPRNFISDPNEIRQLVAFFAWAAWASAANRPSKTYSYTNNFPYDPAVGNWPTSARSCGARSA